MVEDVPVSAIRRLMLASVCLAVAACNPVPAEDPALPLPAEGLHAVIKANGQMFDLKVTAVTGKEAVVEIRWDDQLVSLRQLYRGLYPISGSDNGFEFVNEFDQAAVDRLFPLAVGKDSAFEGLYRVVGSNVVGTSWVHIGVSGESTLKLKDGEYKVFVIDITTDLEIEGRSVNFSKVVHFSPELGLALKTTMTEGGMKFYSRILSVDHPEPAPQNDNERNRLGTMMI